MEHPSIEGGGRPLPADDRVPLCLSANRGHLGLELSEPVEIGPLVVESLVLVFENLRFPLDLSGGVPAFRHRRGRLQRISLSMELDRLRRWLEPRIRSAVGGLDRPLDLWLTDTGFGFGWVRESSAITGELHWVPQGEDARFVIDAVRGIDPSQVVLGQVLRILDAALSEKFSRHGRIWTSRHVGQKIARMLLPAAGARVPATHEVNFGMLLPDVDRVRMELDTRNRENGLAASALRALELAELVTLADDALVQGNLDQARQEYMRALELAPRHRELVLIVAELDLLAGGREYAALGLISETLPTIAAGRIAAELLQKLGDRGGADEALDAAIRSEHYAPLRALLQLRKATFDNDARKQMEVLDAAVAAAPTLSVVRWVRFESRAKRGDIDGALADAQYLETCATGSRSKFDVCMRCGLALFEAGLGPQASRFFERALRYRPDDPKAAVGLARSFVNVGQANRAISLLERAIVASDTAGQVDSHAQLLLACLLVKHTADLPQAIARVRQISAGSDVAVEARLWEARWRLALGDVVGTSVAWARMRELVELGHQTSNAGKWLVEAAIFEREIRHDLVCAERHLAIALRVAPHDSEIDTLYREVASSLAASVPRTHSPSTREPK